MEDTKEQVEVTLVFPIAERQVIHAVLKSFAWQFTAGLRVQLRQGEMQLPAKQVGSGSSKGQAIVTLSPLGTWTDAMAVLDRFAPSAESPIYLERVILQPEHIAP